MSQLIIVAFDGQDTADEVLSKLQDMKQDWLVSLEEVAILRRDPQGGTHLTRSSNLTDETTVAGGSLGVLLGLVVAAATANPVIAAGGLLLGVTRGCGHWSIGGGA